MTIEEAIQKYPTPKIYPWAQKNWWPWGKYGISPKTIMVLCFLVALFYPYDAMAPVFRAILGAGPLVLWSLISVIAQSAMSITRYRRAKAMGIKYPHYLQQEWEYGAT